MTSISSGTITTTDPTLAYELLTCEGKGSFGAVYKALRRQDATIVAVKVIQIPTAEHEIEALHREVQMLRECNHSNITEYTSAYIYEETLWIVMEYCGGGSIADILKHFPLPTDQIALVAREVLKGLLYLHSREQLKIHRDIKGANILLNDKGEIKLADFGVSKQLQETIAKADTFVGTPYWMAPEVLSGEQYDGKADVWSVGIACIEMAEKLPPLYEVHPMRVIMMIPNNDPPKLKEAHKFSPEFAGFLKFCLAKDPKTRPTASECLEHSFFHDCSSSENLMASVHRRMALEKKKLAPERKKRQAAFQGMADGATIHTTTTMGDEMTISDDTKTDMNNAILDEWDDATVNESLPVIAEDEEEAIEISAKDNEENTQPKKELLKRRMKMLQEEARIVGKALVAEKKAEALAERTKQGEEDLKTDLSPKLMDSALFTLQWLG